MNASCRGMDPAKTRVPAGGLASSRHQVRAQWVDFRTNFIDKYTDDTLYYPCRIYPS